MVPVSETDISGRSESVSKFCKSYAADGSLFSNTRDIIEQYTTKLLINISGTQTSSGPAAPSI